MSIIKERYEGDDPFMCKECRLLGYCRKRSGLVKTHFDENLSKRLINHSVLKILTDALPTRTILFKTNSPLAAQMQYAHDAFRDQDFESSILVYKTILENGYYNWEAVLGLALSLYYLEDYKGASEAIERMIVDGNANWVKAVQQFFDLCNFKLGESIPDHSPNVSAFVEFEEIINNLSPI